MIFATVGHQMPFDRMIRLLDDWAGANPQTPVFAQLGESSYKPRHMQYAQLLDRHEYDDYMGRCTAVVAHAGTGTIIDVLLRNKPLLVFPRLSSLGETRNDHQVGTARHFAAKGQLLAAYDEQEFPLLMGQLLKFRPARDIGSAASPELLECLRQFVAA